MFASDSGVAPSPTDLLAELELWENCRQHRKIQTVEENCALSEN